MKTVSKPSLSGKFLKFDIFEECIDSSSLTSGNEEYQKLLPNVNKTIKKANIASRNAIQRIASVTFDGNIEKNGYSSNESVAKFQKDFNNTLTHLYAENNDFLKLDTTIVNSVLSGAISIPIPDDNYYQSVDIKRDGTGILTKPYNVFFHPKHLLDMLKNSYLMGKSIISDDLFTFSTALLGFFESYYKASQETITSREVIVLLYMTKYGNKPIKLDGLYSNIIDHPLDFSECASIKEKNITFEESELTKILQRLSELHIILISNDTEGNKIISIVEKINI